MRRWHIVTERWTGFQWQEMAKPGPGRIFRFRRDAEIVARRICEVAELAGQTWRLSVRRRRVKE